MNLSLILFWQVLTMFFLALAGYLMFHFGKISLEGGKTLGNILIYLSLPCVIIRGFLVDFSVSRLYGLLYSALAATLLLVLSILISRLFFRSDSIAAFASAFSNPGFFGIPLITAAINEEAVFYVASFIAFLNLLQWTYGVSLLTEKKSGFRPSALFRAPFFIAILTGLFFFLTPIPVPALLQNGMTFMAGLNTPLAMFTIGIYFSQVKPGRLFLQPRLYAIAAIRLLFIPIAAMFVLSLFPSQWLDLKIALLIAVACPAGSNVAVYAQLHNKDYSYAVETVVLSTIFSIFTLPLLVQCATSVFF